MTENDFLPSGYEQPKTGGGYTKLEVGKTKLRILSKPLMLWVSWNNKVVSRIAFAGIESKPAKGAGSDDSVVHAWGMIVWNYNTSRIEILELDKQGCIASLKSYAENPAWGHPKNYDVIIEKTGSGKENTKYVLTVDPPSPVPNDAIEAYTENPIDLNQLLIPNGNPFLDKVQAANPANVNTQPAATSAKVVTPENWVAGDAVPAGYKVNPDNGLLEKKALPFG